MDVFGEIKNMAVQLIGFCEENWQLAIIITVGIVGFVIWQLFF